MILPLLLALQAGPAVPDAARSELCIALATSDPAAGQAEAERWRLGGGGYAARHCLALAHANGGRWEVAASEFAATARDAELARDRRSAVYWAQAGNAWLAAGDAVRAREALDTALVAGTLDGLQLGEARLDRARALVAAGTLEAARTDLDLALVGAAADPLAWLLSATLARRMGDLPRARKDIAEALRRSADDASVQREAGNIAALSGDEVGARGAWAEAVRLAPDTPVGRSAAAALEQFDAPTDTSAP